MGKRWCKRYLITAISLLLAGGFLNFIVDPAFHYGKPKSWLQYRFQEERYQNDGIVRHFDYDAIITGTSMTQNFKASDFDARFQTNSIKVPFAGGTFREINNNLLRAIEANPNIRYILRGLDCGNFTHPSSQMHEDMTFPTYLYNDNPFDDVEYLINKDVLLEETMFASILWTLSGRKTTAFDDYGYWADSAEFGADVVLEHYQRPEKKQGESLTLNRDNLEQNVISIAREHPEIEFYYFLTPYSIAWFDSLNQQGQLEDELRLQQEAIEMMLPYQNIHLYSFFEETDIITNLDRYKDTTHYDADVNSYILECMQTGRHELTEENYRDYCRNVWEFYTTFDYDEIFLR